MSEQKTGRVRQFTVERGPAGISGFCTFVEMINGEVFLTEAGPWTPPLSSEDDVLLALRHQTSMEVYDSDIIKYGNSAQED